MKFTRLTYWVAIRRALRHETQAFQDSLRGVRGPEPYVRLNQHTNALIRRKQREVGGL